MRLCSCGKFHEPCEVDGRLTALAAAVRADPRVVASIERIDCAWDAYQAGHVFSLEAWLELEKQWRRAVDDHHAVNSAVWAEKRKEMGG